MANEKKNLNGLSKEHKQNVAGGKVYEGRDANGQIVYYVPNPNEWPSGSHKYVRPSYAQKAAKLLGQSDEIVQCASAAEAKEQADEELLSLVAGSNQRRIKDFF